MRDVLATRPVSHSNPERSVLSRLSSEAGKTVFSVPVRAARFLKAEILYFRRERTFSDLSYFVSQPSLQEAHRPQSNTRGRQVHRVLEKDSVLNTPAASCHHRLAAQEHDQCLIISIFLIFILHSRYIN